MTDNPSLHCLTSEAAEFEARIKDELETLNLRIFNLNQLGQEAVEAERDYDNALDESFKMLKSCAMRIGVKAIEKTRPYFKLIKRIQRASEKVEVLKAAFKKANEDCREMKMRFKLVEGRVLESIGNKMVDVESLELLNEATQDVIQALNLKCKYAIKLHEYKLSVTCRQKKVVMLQKTLARDIEKAKPYFDLKFEINEKLDCKKKKIDNAQLRLFHAKREYHEAMETVEKVSEQIHTERGREKINDTTDA